MAPRTANTRRDQLFQRQGKPPSVLSTLYETPEHLGANTGRPAKPAPSTAGIPDFLRPELRRANNQPAQSTGAGFPRASGPAAGAPTHPHEPMRSSRPATMPTPQFVPGEVSMPDPRHFQGASPRVSGLGACLCHRSMSSRKGKTMGGRSRWSGHKDARTRSHRWRATTAGTPRRPSPIPTTRPRLHRPDHHRRCTRAPCNANWRRPRRPCTRPTLSPQHRGNPRPRRGRSVMNSSSAGKLGT